MMDKKSCSNNGNPDRFKNIHSKKAKRSKSEHQPPDIEFIGGSGNGFMEDNDEFELLGVASNDPALELQFGMGSGIYGSGRHTSLMVGN